MLCKFLAFFFFLLIVFIFFSFFSSACEFYLSKKQALMPNKIQDLLLLLSKSVLFMLLKNLYENTLVNVKVSFSVASEPVCT